MYWQILDEKRIEILKQVVKNISLTDYYMIGGTALSLQTGLRKSYDFDFCVQKMFSNNVLLEELKKIGNIEIIQNSKGTCDVLLNEIKFTFLYYPNKVINEFVYCENIPNLKIASILDIAAMKLAAIGGRGAKKDFFDLYNIINRENITIENIIDAFIEKDNNNHNYFNTIMSLSYFEEAEEEQLPFSFVDYDWNKIKKYFLDIQPIVEKYIVKNTDKSEE